MSTLEGGNDVKERGVKRGGGEVMSKQERDGE